MKEGDAATIDLHKEGLLCFIVGQEIIKSRFYHKGIIAR